MSALAEYAREEGSIKASFEAVSVCTSSTDDKMTKGSALQAYDGIRIFSSEGIAFLINGETVIKKVLNTDRETMKRVCTLLSDDNTMKVLSTLDFGIGITDEEISAKCSLSAETVHSALFRLMQLNLCECTSDFKYTFGGRTYAILAVLSGLFFMSVDGQKAINSITRNYPPRDND